jgi:hypothetical protein
MDHQQYVQLWTGLSSLLPNVDACSKLCNSYSCGDSLIVPHVQHIVHGHQMSKKSELWYVP